MSNNDHDGFSASGLIKNIDDACDDIGFYMDAVAGRKVTYEDGKKLIDALYFAKRDIEGAIDDLERVLNDEAVCT